MRVLSSRSRQRPSSTWPLRASFSGSYALGCGERTWNVALLPHLGSATRETRTAMGLRVARNVDLFFGGQPVQDKVV